MIEKINIDIFPKDGKFSTADIMIDEINALRPDDRLEFFVKDVFRREGSVSIGDNSSFNNVQFHSNFQKNDCDNHSNSPTG